MEIIMSSFRHLEVKSANTYVFEIYMAGDISDAKRELVQIASERGACWSVDPTEFIYSGGRELGFIVRIINYPRFPKKHDELKQEAIDVGLRLMKALGQGSFSIVGPNTTLWYSRRKD